MQMIKGAKKRAVKFKSKDDGTYYALTGENVELDDSFSYSGFQFSFVRPEAFKKLNDSDWDFLTEHLLIQAESEEYIGVYKNESETSFKSEIKELAKKFMYLFNQEEILDWKIKKLYPNKSYKWFIKNGEFKKDIEVDYDSIIKKIQANNG